MELILVRHALPVRQEVDGGAADPELAPEGHQQAVLMADYLSSERIDALYTSPMRRARETAAPLAERLDMEAVIVDDVAEWDRNSSEYIPVEQLKAEGDPRFYELLGHQWDGADPVDEFEARVTSALDGLIARHPGETIAVVCHGGVINLYLATVLGLADEMTGFFYPNYTSIHRIAASRSGIKSMITINETSHLRHSGLPMGLFQKG